MFAVPLTERVALYTVMMKWGHLVPAPGCGEWALPAGEDACLLGFEPGPLSALDAVVPHVGGLDGHCGF
jgi:hypothetical protein